MIIAMQIAASAAILFGFRKAFGPTFVTGWWGGSIAMCVVELIDLVSA